MNERHSDFRLSPRPLLRKSERGSWSINWFFVAVVITLGACGGGRSREARAFVAGFYSWYDSGMVRPSNMEVIDLRRSAFTPALAQLIEADEACQRRVEGMCRLGTDMNYFHSISRCERYELGDAIVRQDTVEVPVLGICAGVRDSLSWVTAIVVPSDSGWQFANFKYRLDNMNLVSILDSPE